MIGSSGPVCRLVHLCFFAAVLSMTGRQLSANLDWSRTGYAEPRWVNFGGMIGPRQAW
jgi:hypothetical protein